jgi:hypothetical protein
VIRAKTQFPNSLVATSLLVMQDAPHVYASAADNNGSYVCTGTTAVCDRMFIVMRRMVFREANAEYHFRKAIAPPRAYMRTPTESVEALLCCIYCESCCVYGETCSLSYHSLDLDFLNSLSRSKKKEGNYYTSKTSK